MFGSSIPSRQNDVEIVVVSFVEKLKTLFGKLQSLIRITRAIERKPDRNLLGLSK
jgi:hypothetical protein